MNLNEMREASRELMHGVYRLLQGAAPFDHRAFTPEDVEALERLARNIREGYSTMKLHGGQ